MPHPLAWGDVGTIWPVVHQQLGVRPDMGRRALEVTPQVPPQSPQEELSGKNIRLGNGSVDVSASASNGTYRTTVTPNVTLQKLTIGHTVPRDAKVVSATLNGNAISYEVRNTNRAKEVLVKAATSGGADAGRNDRVVAMIHHGWRVEREVVTSSHSTLTGVEEVSRKFTKAFTHL